MPTNAHFKVWFLLIQLPYFHLLLRQLSLPFDLAPKRIGPAVTLFFPRTKKAEAFGSLDTEIDFFLSCGIPSYPSIRPLSSYQPVCPVLIWMRNSKAQPPFVTTSLPFLSSLSRSFWGGTFFQIRTLLPLISWGFRRSRRVWDTEWDTS